jgi:thymidylate synthase (FAD)
MPWNEVSRRYVDDEPEFYEPDVWRGRADDKKQGSAGAVESVPVGALKVQGYCLAAYQDLLSSGICPEQARMVLPQSTMTEWYWSGTLGAWAKMCNLRCKPDTQLETRIVGNEVSGIMLRYFPVSWEALKHDY